MNILSRHSELITKKIDEMPIGAEYGLVQIFGEDWESIRTVGERRDFGKKFKAAVKVQTIFEVEWLRIENSGRYDVYKKK